MTEVPVSLMLAAMVQVNESIDRSICELPKVAGPCRAAILRYFYNKNTGECEEFYYGGCGGNCNNFQTKEECENKCK